MRIWKQKKQRQTDVFNDELGFVTADGEFGFCYTDVRGCVCFIVEQREVERNLKREEHNGFW